MEPQGIDPSEEDAKRVFACERCSRRKQRCDRILPVCTPCRLVGSPCVSSDREEAVVQGKDREITRKGYVTLLLERIAALEKKVQNHRPSVPITETDARVTAPAVRPPPTHGQRPPPEMNTSSLSLSVMAEPQNRDGEFLKHLSISRIIAGATETYGGNPEASSRGDSLWDGISRYIRHPISATYRLHIDRSEAVKALTTYIDVVDFRFPRLPAAKVLAGIEAISAPDDARYRHTLTQDPAHIFMAYAVIAIVPLVSDKYPISQASWVSVHLLGKCLKVLDRVFNHEDGVDIIHCLQLLVILAIHCSAAGSAWHLVGFAMNKCIALGYHREDPKNVSGIPTSELQQRRWAFWGCYHLDCLISAALGRQSSIDERHITVPLPDWSTELGPRDAFHTHLFRYATILSSVIRDGPISLPSSDIVSSDFEHFLGRALHWRSTTPQHDNIELKDVYLFHTSLYHTLILRLAIREILPGFESNEPSTSTAVSTLAQTQNRSSDESHDKRAIIVRLKLAAICQAVARSLDRTRMTGRPYLSLMTGYSAFSMALACLYCLAVDGIKSIDSGSCGGDELGYTFNNLPRRLNQRPLWPQDSQSEADYGPSFILDIATQKLEVAGRQFPRLADYRLLVQRMRSLLEDWRLRQHQDPPSDQLKEEYDAIRDTAERIGPPHLRLLATGILRTLQAGTSWLWP